MTRLRVLTCAVLTSVAVAAGVTDTLEGQVGRCLNVVDPNIAGENELLALPRLNATLVKGILERRPFLA